MSPFRSKRIKVQVCGKTIWNYPSEKVLGRGGWLQYSVIARGSRIEHTFVLCRNWREFWELNRLAFFRYFTSASWSSWSDDGARQTQLQLGFVSYLQFSLAEEMTTRQQSGARGRGPRTHDIVEYKNIICGYIKRNDPVSRRFVQNLQMQSGKLCVLIRDAKTGRVLAQPPEEHLWLSRRKGGMGRAAKNHWVVGRQVGEDLFNIPPDGKQKDWRFGFNDYYDLQVWDLQGGQPFLELHGNVQEQLMKADRFCTGMDFYKDSSPILNTLYSDNVTHRVRDAQPGVQTMWDDIKAGKVNLVHTHNETGEVIREDAVEKGSSLIGHLFYNEVDADENVVLFPGEATQDSDVAIPYGSDPITAELIDMPPSLKRLILDLDSDEDSDEFDDPGHSGTGDDGMKRRRAITAKEQGMVALSVCSNPDNDDCECKACEWIGNQCVGDTFPWLDKHERNSLSLYLKDFDDYTADKGLVKQLKDFAFRDTYHDAPRDPQADFFVYMDRQKSKVVKKQWHAAELNPKVRERWNEMQDLIQQSKERNAKQRGARVECVKLLMDSGVDLGEHRLVSARHGDGIRGHLHVLPGEGIR